ncbi:hypothetical protein GMLC_06350 [Geomonas limicola]|uniref:Uncharacterized protein n=1 Tax=Geomonas limicola TaxID=2740186 RepID=A0A6V8N3G4_9BACT|nr:hypothetical protein [Geomonas limicola]GFO67056.1 hypothetical protein GMLC_06350 [Geomonas limicola]
MVRHFESLEDMPGPFSRAAFRAVQEARELHSLAKRMHEAATSLTSGLAPLSNAAAQLASRRRPVSTRMPTAVLTPLPRPLSRG